MMASENPKEVIELLKSMQRHLMAVRHLEHEIAETPKRIAALDADTEAQKTAVARAEERLKEETLNSSRLEGELKDTQEAHSDKQVQTLSVKTNEQLWAIQKEIKFLEDKISDTEMKIIESMEALDTRSSELEDAKKRFAVHSSENQQRIGELRKNLEQMEKDIVEEKAVYEEITPQIPNKYTRLLARIQASKSDGVAMSEVQDGTCVACHFRVRPQVFLEIRTGQAIHQCTNCSRILYYVREGEQAEAS